MRPVAQDMSHPRGNCLQAAVASVLNMPVEWVPDVSKDDQNWLEDLIAWAVKEDYGVVSFHTNSLVPLVYNVWVVAIGHRPGNINGDTHAVVAKAHTVGDELRLTMMHDPHPSQAFIEDVVAVLFFTKQ